MVKIVNWFNTPTRMRKADDKPENVFGSMFAWVREWDTETKQYMWFPGEVGAYDPRSYGPSVRIHYSKLENLRFRHNPDGTFTPYFVGKLRVKSFNMRKDDFTDIAKKRHMSYSGSYLAFIVLVS